MEEKEIEETAKKFNIDLEKLKNEQKKLAKTLKLKDDINFENIDKIAGIENISFQNKIISGIVVINKEFEVLEKQYFIDKIKFPYLSGFRAYRELPCMLEAFNLVEERPDIVLVRGNGILHPRNFGLASHFSVLTGTPCIGVADELMIGELKGEDVYIDGKLCGKMLKTKEGGNPIYISPGNLISLKSCINIVKSLVKEPHKFPEPLRVAKKYAKEVMEELR